MFGTFAPRFSRLEQASLALTAALLIFAGIAALVSMPKGSTTAVLGPAPSTTEAPAAFQRDGRVLSPVHDAGLLGVVVDANDPTLLHVIVAHGTGALECSVFRPQVRATAQSASIIRIAVSGYEYLAARGHGGTTCITAGSVSVPLRLNTALGDRHVYDGSASQATTVADPDDLPRPRSVPAGYRSHSTTRVRPDVDALVAERTYTRGRDRLTVRVGDRFSVTSAGRAERSATVEGQYATVTRDGQDRCVTWTELSGRVRQLCSQAAKPSTPIARDRLLAIARGLAG